MKRILFAIPLLMFFACENNSQYDIIIDRFKVENKVSLDNYIKNGRIKESEREYYEKRQEKWTDSVISVLGKKGFCDSLTAKAKRDSIINVKFLKLTDSLNAINDALKDDLGLEFNKEWNDTLKQEVKKFKVDKDEFKKTNYYYNYKPTVFANYILIYLGSDNSMLWGRFKIGFASDDWLFVQDYQFLCDDKVFSYTPSDEVVRENSGGDVYEYIDVNYNKKINEIVKAIISSKVAKIRYNGRDHIKDRVISDAEKKNLKEMYDILN